MTDKYSEYIDKLVNGPNSIKHLIYQIESDWLCGRGVFVMRGHLGCMTIAKNNACMEEFLGPLDLELKEDDRIANNPRKIIPDHMKDWEFPLTEDQRDQVKGLLEPYAEWGRRFDVTD